MSEHKLPFQTRAGLRLLGVTARQRRTALLIKRVLRGTFTPVKLTPGSNRWRRFRDAAKADGTTALANFFQLHGAPPDAVPPLENLMWRHQRAIHDKELM